MHALVMSVNDACYDNDDIFKGFAKKFANEITIHCNITKDTEHQLDNFGPGSAWLYESPYSFTVEYTAGFVTLYIKSKQAYTVGRHRPTDTATPVYLPLYPQISPFLLDEKPRYEETTDKYTSFL